uniref:Dual specificity protein phosphatase 22 n=1 Tax=Salvator merianae TaxID=96440 RepID=A0A8D0BH41_SALMN
FFLASSQIVGGLYLGNIRDAEDRENLAKNGITHILSVHNNAKPVLETEQRLHSRSDQRGPVLHRSSP